MNWFTTLLDLVEKIPATFWGVVFGSFIALGGVIVTNRANDRRFQAQLAHDRELKAIERELALRKDIYLDAAEAVSAGLTAISQFGNLNISNDKLTEAYINKSSSITKVYVIAKEKTAEAIAEFVRELEAAYLRLYTKRYPLVAEKNQLGWHKEHINSFTKERDRMLELMKQFNIEGKMDQRRWDVLQNNFDFAQKQIDETVQKHDALLATHYTKQLEYMKACVAESNGLFRVLIPLLVAVRDELELPFNENSFMKIIGDSLKKQEETLEKFFRDLQDLGKPQ